MTGYLSFIVSAKPGTELEKDLFHWEYRGAKAVVVTNVVVISASDVREVMCCEPPHCSRKREELVSTASHTELWMSAVVLLALSTPGGCMAANIG